MNKSEINLRGIKALEHAEDIDRRMGWMLTSNRSIRPTTIRELVHLGALASVGACEMADGDGFMRPGVRTREGFQLTDVGRELLGRIKEARDSNPADGRELVRLVSSSTVGLSAASGAGEG